MTESNAQIVEIFRRTSEVGLLKSDLSERVEWDENMRYDGVDIVVAKKLNKYKARVRERYVYLLCFARNTGGQACRA